MKPSLWTRFAGVTVASVALVMAACSDQKILEPEAAPGPDLSPLFSHVEGSFGSHIMVMTAESDPSAELLAAIAAAGGAVQHQYGFGVLDIAGLSDAASAALAARADVEGIDRDLLVRWIPDMNEVTVDSDQSGAFFFPYQWNLPQIGADAAWLTTAQGTGATVAILDTGGDPLHQDLAGKYLASSASMLSPGSSACGAFDETTIYDLNFHGSFVGAIVSSNGIDMASVAPDASLIAVKVLNCDGFGYFSDIIDGIDYAAAVGADVMNLSLGAYFSKDLPGAKELVKAVERAVKAATKSGTLVVASSGNDGINMDEDPKDYIYVPAQLKNVISVGATGPTFQVGFDDLAPYSNYGKKGADLVAPGGNYGSTGYLFDGVISVCATFVCGYNYGYLVGDGTSFASPHVAGAAAVVESETPGDSKGADLGKCILKGVDDLGDPGKDAIYGAGRLNVPDAVACKSNKSQKSSKSDKSDKSGKSGKGGK